MEGNPGDGRTAAGNTGRNRGWLWVLLLLFAGPAVAITILMVVIGASIVQCVKPSQCMGEGVDEFPTLRETWSYGHGSTKVVRIPVKGVLIESEATSLFSSRGPVETVLRQIRAATVDDSIRAIILEVDSPGGGVTASDIIYKALLDFKAKSEGRKVIALFGDLAASGGYYVATAADYIIAHPTSLTGSLSVLITQLNVKQLGDQYGVRMETIKSGKNKDMLSPFSNLSDEQRIILQELVDEMHGRFVECITKARSALSADEVRSIADGRIFTSKKALELKLIDQIGYWDDAVAKTSELLGEDEVKVMKYADEFSLSAMLSGVDSAPLSINSLLGKAGRIRVMSIWQP